MRTLIESISAERPLQIIGVSNAYVAIMAQSAGYKALYLSGAGIANLCFGLPDLGVTTLENVAEEVRRIAGAIELPLLVDMDTGWGDPKRAVEALIEAGASGAHIEDQVPAKRCGHREGKELISAEEMCARIRSAVKGKGGSEFMVMARTDALADEGLEATIERAVMYEEAGADALFAEAFTDLEQYRALRKAISIPILANITEFGKTPLFGKDELAEAGIDMILYPLSAARAMNRAALDVLQDIRENGTQKGSIDVMQTRDELYKFLDYEAKEPR